MLVLKCPGCSLDLKTDSVNAGRKAKCPRCGQIVPIPAEDITQAPPEPDGVDSLQVQGAYTFLTPPQAPNELGRLGQFRILGLLGEGGMGVVFRAEDTMLHRPVALKALLPNAAASPQARERFLREARILASVEHDHVVAIHHVGEQNGVPFLAMPLLQGEPLDARVNREGRLPVAEVLRIGNEMAQGLAAAHALGLVHRDIKPANVWLEGKRGRVKLLDFGLARQQQSTREITQEGTIVGTPAYMSPEQTRGELADARSDLFALGCVLYRMSVGRPAFEGKDVISILVSVAMHEPPAPHLVADVPIGLSVLVMRLLSKDVASRPGSAEAVAAELAALATPEDVPEAAAVVVISAIDASVPVAPNPWGDLTMSDGFEAVQRQDETTEVGDRRCGGWIRGALAAGVVLGLGLSVALGVVFALRPQHGTLVSGGEVAIEATRETKSFEPKMLDAPFGPAAGRASQQEWAAHLGMPVEEELDLGNGVKLAMVLVPPGKFTMGSPEGEAGRVNSEAAHTVMITRPYWMGKYEVTVGQFRRFVEDAGYQTESEADGKGASGLREDGLWEQNPKFTWKTPGLPQTDEHPVVCISHRDTAKFCEWASGKTRKALRLPTEAEWERACRAGTETPFSFGSVLNGEKANCNGDIPYGTHKGPFLKRTTPVGKYGANALGFSDMHGNVHELCSDWFGDYPSGKTIDPTGPKAGRDRVLRGGTWHDISSLCRSAFRGGLGPGNPSSGRGFRLVHGADSPLSSVK